MSIVRLLVAAAAGSAMAVMGPRPAAADAATLGLGLEIYAAGLHALSIDARIRLDGNRYESVAKTRTQGLLEMLFGHRGELRSEGVVRDDGTRPRHYRAGSRSNFGTTALELTYLTDGTVASRFDPADEDDDRVPQRLRRDTLDPLSAFLVLARSRSAAEACRGTVKIFDGRRRYDLVFSYVGSGRLAANPYGLYAGAVEHCRARYRRIRDDGTVSTKRPRPPADVWLAKLGSGGALVPVRIDAETRWGLMVAHLARLTPAPKPRAP